MKIDNQIIDIPIDRGLVSVVIPLYNGERTIIRALDSLRMQTAIQSIKEIIIVDDGSTDKSFEIVEKYSSENKDMPILVIRKNNGGVSTARNTGLKSATGIWIALLDADDEWLINKLEIQLNCILEHPEIDFLGGSVDEKDFKILGKKISSLYKVCLSDLCFKMFPQTSTVIFKRKIFYDIGGYDETQSHAEDGNYFMKICVKYNYYYLPIQMTIYDNGKRGFGYSGLSSNLKKMYLGNIKNIRELNSKQNISTPFYTFLRSFYFMKYLRRIVITKMIGSK